MPFDPTAANASLGFWTGVATQNYYTRVLAKLQQHDLEKWFYMLLLIHEATEKLSQQDLADALLLDKVTVTRAVDHLSAKGFVERIACPDDRRKHHLRTLPRARAVVKDVRAAFESINELAFTGMNATERKRFKADLARINANLAQPEGRKMRITYSKKQPR
ncbi:MAG: MarR family transcriptional regulator [Flavobacteriales bacterium]|nr:MarR family transcriptional regulator [Flavobacteriales bacterium]